MMMLKVAVLMGSGSDADKMSAAAEVLAGLEAARGAVISVHRTPDAAREFAQSARNVVSARHRRRRHTRTRGHSREHNAPRHRSSHRSRRPGWRRRPIHADDARYPVATGHRRPPMPRCGRDPPWANRS